MLFGISETANVRTFKPLPLCSAPWKLTDKDFWSSSNERSSFSQKKCVLRKCCRVSQKQQMWELSNLCHCVQHPWKLTGRHYWGFRNTRMPLSKLKHVFRKCSGVSQKEWVLELSNLCHCVQHPWKLTGRDYWSSRNKRKPLSKLKHVFRKCSGVSQKQWVLELSNLAIVFSTPENILVGISGAIGMKESHFLSKMCFEEMLLGISETANVRTFKPLSLCSAPLKTYW